MKVLVAGATGAIGRQLVPKLVQAAHDVIGMVRSSGSREAVRAMGARAVTADALEIDQVGEAVAAADPEVSVHELTAIRGTIDMRHFDDRFAHPSWRSAFAKELA